MTAADIIRVVRPVTRVFDDLKVPHYIGGSVASSVYGIARATMDVEEVLSIRSERIPHSEGVHLTPVPFDEGISSLSAILLQEEYYAFLKAGVRIVDGISVVGPEHLVPLKARAWLDLKERKAARHDIHSGDISKHRKDVFRLYRIIDPTPRRDVPLSSCRGW